MKARKAGREALPDRRKRIDADGTNPRPRDPGGRIRNSPKNGGARVESNRRRGKFP
jgi:hypothetical protein